MLHAVFLGLAITLLDGVVSDPTAEDISCYVAARNYTSMPAVRSSYCVEGGLCHALFQNLADSSYCYVTNSGDCAGFNPVSCASVLLPDISAGCRKISGLSYCKTGAGGYNNCHMVGKLPDGGACLTVIPECDESKIVPCGHAFFDEL